jgi:Fe-S-cluster containining protein
MTLAAGPFGAWLAQTRSALRGGRGAEVPCGDCTGCCTSGYSIQLRPTDRAALEVVPEGLLEQVPGFPKDERTLPPGPDGCCPMLVDGGCSIYARRPQTCVDYDCRIFAAAGLDAGGARMAVINRRVREWEFSYETDAERTAHEAIRAAARFMRERRASFGASLVPASSTGIAVFAIKAGEVFREPGIGSLDDTTIAQRILEANRAFDRQSPDA